MGYCLLHRTNLSRLEPPVIPSQLLPDEPFAFADEAAKALYAPIGAASPLWFLFAGATTAGLAFWWAGRWTKFTNLEAMFAPAVGTAEAVVEVAPLELVPAPEAEPEPKAGLVEVASPPAAATKLAEPQSPPKRAVEAVAEPVTEAATEPKPTAHAKAPKGAPGPEA
jgi:hypothetical protein